MESSEIGSPTSCNPVAKMQKCDAFLGRPHRLVGLGHRAFNAATRVRIPLGTPLVPKYLQDLFRAGRDLR
jgi:hypothetical protein